MLQNKAHKTCFLLAMSCKIVFLMPHFSNADLLANNKIQFSLWVSLLIHEQMLICVNPHEVTIYYCLQLWIC